MEKNYDKFNKFCKKYDMYSDGIEEEVVEFLRGKFPKAYEGAKKISWMQTMETRMKYQAQDQYLHT